jgi:CTP:molybdopterin cytidylyltransferase MocA
MTVAAVILIPELAVGLADADGEPAVRRVAHAAWSGGALPVVIVSDDPGPALAEALAGMPVTFTRPGPDEARGVAWFVHGLRAAQAAVGEATAALLWPVRYAWVDPETITSLVESHGGPAAQIVRPAFAGQSGFPILVPMAFADRLTARFDLHANDAVAALIADGAAVMDLELGDPGIVYDLATPRASLPEYQGPPRPAAAASERAD